MRSEVLNHKGNTDDAASSRRAAEDSSGARHSSSTRASRKAAGSQATAGSSATRGRYAKQSTSDARTESRSRSASGAQATSNERTLIAFVKKNWRYIASVVGVALLAVILIFLLRGCMSSEDSTPSESSSSASKPYVSPYDWTKVERTNDQRMAYVVDGVVVSRQGIDVSENQHEIDWEAVAADGIDFAIIRVGYRGATEGELYLDECFEYNLAAAKEAGVDVGVYFFSQAVDEEEAIEEAEFVIEHLNGVYLEYPVAFDSEVVRLAEGKSRTAGLSSDDMNAIQEAFRQRIELAGYRTIVYGNASDLSRYKMASLKQTNLWWAEYNTPSPTAQIDIVIWQYSNAGEVDGIETAVDMNIDLSRVLAG